MNVEVVQYKNNAFRIWVILIYRENISELFGLFIETDDGVFENFRPNELAIRGRSLTCVNT